MKKIRKILRKLLHRGFTNQDEYINYLRKKGIQIGKNCRIYDCNKVNIDTQNPWMLTMGDNVRITEGVQILTHDYSFSVLCSVKGDVVGSVEKTTIGNNIFIGRNAIILKGVCIGDNVIIGAGSVVTSDCESNYVYAGNPAKKICSIEKLYEKRKAVEIENAKQVAISYYKKTNNIPPKDVLREYQMIFEKRDSIPDSLNELFKDSGVYELCEKNFYNTKPTFECYEDFLKWCGILSK